MARRGLTAAIAALLVAGCDTPPESPAAAEAIVEVAQARVLDPRATGRTSFYATLKNRTPAPDSLLSIEAVGAGDGSLHQMAMEDGMMRMSALSAIAIPAQGSVELSPGGLHGMFEEITATWPVGDSIDVTMRFSRAPTVTVRAIVVSPADAR